MEAYVPNFLIALREGVEAALIVGILVAYLKKVGREDVMRPLWIGVVVAALIPLALGAYWTWGASSISFQAQEIIGGSLSIVAVVFVTWMIFWMGKNSSKIGAGVKEQAAAALESGSTWALVWIAIISVGREGIETAIFVWAVVKSTATTSIVGPTLGVWSGLVAAVIIGYLVYKGSTAINLHAFFNITGYLLIFVAAGILMYGIGDLQEANVIPGWHTYLYDYSPLIADVAGSWWFVLLNAFFNVQYLFSPTTYQFIAWAAYLVVVLPLFTLQITGKIWSGRKAKAEVAAAGSGGAS